MEETFWETEEFIFDGGEFFDDLVQDIDAANESVALETYIFEFDQVGHRVANALVGAAKRGVSVRLLIDGFGSPFFGGENVEAMARSGIQVQIYNSIPWHYWQWPYSKIILKRKLSGLLKLFGLLNRRNHRKLCVLDNKKAWIGSFNITEKHLPCSKGGESWHDVAVRLTGAAVAKLHLSAPKNADTVSLPFLTNETRLLRRRKNEQIQCKIESAIMRVWIATPYFVPPISLVQELKRTALRGVDVRLVLAGKSDVPIVKYFAKILYRTLIKSGVKIFEYNPHILHSKLMLIDEWILLGSSNLNSRSYFRDLELDAILQKPLSISGVEKYFFKNFDESILIIESPQWFSPSSIIGRFFSFLRGWM